MPAIKFFDPLSLYEKDNLATLLKKTSDILITDLSLLLQNKISYPNAIHDLKLVAAGGASAYPWLRDTQNITDAHLDIKFLNILPT